MSCIGWPREADRELHDLYARKLLEPGWAGEVDSAEAAYIARELSKRPALRRVWHVAEFTRYRRRITPAIVRRLARVWTEMPTMEIEAQVTDMVGPKKTASMREPLLLGLESNEARLSLGPLVHSRTANCRKVR